MGCRHKERQFSWQENGAIVRSLGPSNPGILPSHLDVVVVATEANESPVTVRELQSLVFADGQGECCAEPRAGLTGGGTRYTSQGGGASEPVVAIERRPESRALSEFPA